MRPARVRWLRAGDDAWDRLVADSPQGSLYCTTRYLQRLAPASDYLIVEQEGALLGGVALPRNELGVRGNPLFAKYLGVLYSSRCAENPGAHARVDQALLGEFSSHEAWSYAFSPAFHDWTRFHAAGFDQTTRYTFRIDFEKTPDFRAAYGEKVRAPLRAARRHRITIAEVPLDEFLRVNRLTYAARGGRPPYSDQRLRQLLEGWRSDGILCARSARDPAGRTHAVAATVADTRDAHLLLNGSDPDLRGSGANTLLMDHMIEQAAARSARFDFEGSMHARIAAFYRGFGGALTPYFLISRRNVATWGYRAMLRGAQALLGK